jgi:hypothetical protein
MRIIEVKDPAHSQPWLRLLSSNINPSARIAASYFEYRKLYLGNRMRAQHFAFAGEEGNAICGTGFELIADDDGSSVLTAIDIPSALIWADGVSVEERRGAEAMIVEHIAGLGERYGAAHIEFADPLLDGAPSSLSRWAHERNAAESKKWWQIIDLTKTETALWSDLRKSYKGCINGGRRKLDVRVTRGRDSFDALRRLHFEAAGRNTRSDETWEAQWKTVVDGEAFLATSALDGVIVSASYFQLTRHDCYYGVSAADRSLFKLPLNHAPMWDAIRHAKELGCLRFHLGEQVWEAEGATRKEAAIAEFKRGFGGETVPEIILDVTLKESETLAPIA